MPNMMIGAAGLTPILPPKAPIQPRRWYPYGRDDDVYVTRVVDGVAYGYATSPLSWGADTVERRLDALALQVALQPQALAERIGALEARIESSLKMGFDPAWLYRDKAWLEALQYGDAGPEVWLDDSVHIDVELQPTAAFYRDAPEGQRDFWVYIDSKTGGCCNAARSCVSGLQVYEASSKVAGLRNFLADECVKVVAVNAHLPGDAAAYVSPEVNELLARQVPSPQLHSAIDAQWEQQRTMLLPQLDEALRSVVAPRLKAQGLDVFCDIGRNDAPPAWRLDSALSGAIEVAYGDANPGRVFTPHLWIYVDLNGDGAVESFRAHDTIGGIDVSEQVLKRRGTARRYADQLVILDHLQQQGCVLPGEPLIGETIKAAYGRGGEQWPEESRDEWISRCAHRLLEDFHRGASVLADVAAPLVEQERTLRRKAKPSQNDNGMGVEP